MEMSAPPRCPQCQAVLGLEGSCGPCSAVDASAVDADSPFSPPTVPDAAVPEDFEEVSEFGRRATRGQRWAGGLLLVAVTLNLLYVALFPADSKTFMLIVPSLIDAAIGISLLRGHSGTVNWAILRVVLGAFIWGGQAIVGGDFISAAMQLALSASLLLLLVGRASPPRIWIGAGLAVPMIFLTVLGLTIGPDGVYRGQVQAADRSALTGPGYELSLPSDAWRVFDAVQMTARNPEVDTWLVMPISDSHVQVIVESLKEPLDLQTFENNVLRNARRSTDSYEVRSRDEVEGGVILHAFGAPGTTTIEYRHRLYVSDDFAAQVVAFGTEGKLHPEALQIVRSAKLGGP